MGCHHPVLERCVSSRNRMENLRKVESTCMDIEEEGPRYRGHLPTFEIYSLYQERMSRGWITLGCIDGR